MATSLAMSFEKNSRTRGAADIDHAHVRHIEDAGVAPHRMVLLDLRAVVDGHVPAAEVDHAGALLDVQVI